MDLFFFGGGFEILFSLAFFAVLAVILVTAVRGLLQWNQNNHSPRLTVPAVVAAKRTATTLQAARRTSPPAPLITPRSRWKAATAWNCAFRARNTACWPRATAAGSPFRAHAIFPLNGNKAPALSFLYGTHKRRAAGVCRQPVFCCLLSVRHCPYF